MKQIAFDTGGMAITNTNDLSRAVDDAIGNGSDFYTLAYTPPPSPDDKAKFRSIQVSLRGEPYTLSYRHGYYTDPAQGARSLLPGLHAGPDASSEASLKRALLVGGPEPTELLLKIQVTPTDRGGRGAVAEGNSLNPGRNRLAGPFQQFAIAYAAASRNISFQRTADNRYHADLDFVACLYDGKGLLVNAVSNTVRTEYDPATFLKAFRTGIPFVQQVSIPEYGVFTLRIAVHDNLSDRVGAVEIPVAAVRQLPLVTAGGRANAKP